MIKQQFDQLAVDQFVKRKQTPPIQVENSKLLAGEPMYFYCKHCGHLSDTLPEDYLFPPRLECSQCLGLKTDGLMERAVQKAKDHR